MEREKRKRSDNEKNSEEATMKKKKGREEEEAILEEEVEEFFAILRRMKVAVQYFEKGNGEGWRKAVEAEVALAVEVVKEGDNKNSNNSQKLIKKLENVRKNTGGSTGLDLNVKPEAETSEA